MNRQTAKLFMCGCSQVVRLPREFRFEGDVVLIERRGDSVVLSSMPKSWREFFEEVPLPSEDFMEERVDLAS